MGTVEATIKSIERPDGRARALAGERLDSLTKPRGSLGHLEEIVGHYAAARHDANAELGRPGIAVFVADHGVADEAVSAYPKAVTTEMLRNFARGGAAISVMARHFGYDLRVVDVGVETDTTAEALPGVLYRRIAPGTRSFLSGPAMTEQQAVRALEVGIELSALAAEQGATLAAIGEMGIGNSTSATALLAAMTGISPARLVGRGTGLDDRGVRRKLEVVTTALSLHAAPLASPLSTLAALGGFEIGAMAGMCLGAAARRLPVVVDGFIATAAAVVARGFYPPICDHLFFGHRSAEGGHPLVLEALGVRPILQLDMRLGEGTGAVLAMSVICTALELYHQMATFAQAGVSSKVQ